MTADSMEQKLVRFAKSLKSSKDQIVDLHNEINRMTKVTDKNAEKLDHLDVLIAENSGAMDEFRERVASIEQGQNFLQEQLEKRTYNFIAKIDELTELFNVENLDEKIRTTVDEKMKKILK